MNRSSLRLSIIVLLSGFLCGCLERQKEEVEIGYRGEARRNPFLAWQYLCEARGYTADSFVTANDWPSPYTVMVMPAEGITTEGRTASLKQWIDQGGHLVYLASDGGYRSWTDFDFSTSKDLDEHPLLKAFGIGLRTGQQGSTEVDLGVDTLAVDVVSDLRFDLSQAKGQRDLPRGPDSQPAFASLSYGYGRLTVAATARPFRNRQIGEADHAALAMTLIDLSGDRHVWFVYGDDLSFIRLLWQHGKWAVVSVGLLLLTWLWFRMPRFGPLLPPAPAATRVFSSHLEMTGQFLWRHGAQRHLVDGIRRRLVKRYQLATGGHLPPFDDHALHTFLAERSGMAHERIQALFTGKAEKDQAAFTRTIQDLTLLEKHL